MTRLKPKVRRAKILQAALECASKKGYLFFTRTEVAQQADVADALINRYFSTMYQLRRAVMCEAVRQENLKIISQGLVSNDINAQRASKELKARAIQAIL